MENKNQPLSIKVENSSYKGSMYSQLVGVTVTDIDITLEFVYINPKNKVEGEIVSRVTLPRYVGEELAQTILNTVQVHNKGKKGEKDD